MATSRCPSAATASASPARFAPGRDLVEAGVPLDAAIAMSGELAAGLQPIAHKLVMLVADRVAQDAESALASNDSGHQAALIEVVQALRPLAAGVVAEELELAMNDEIQKHLGQLMDRLLVETGRSDPAGDSVDVPS